MSKRSIVSSFIKWRKVYMSRVQRRQNLGYAASILNKLHKHSLKQNKIRFMHHIQNIQINHRRKLDILPAIVGRISLRCNVAFYRLLGHCNTMKKRAEIFQKVAASLRERSLFRSFVKVKKYALKKSFKDNSLKIHAYCLLRNYVGNAHISIAKRLISDLKSRMEV